MSSLADLPELVGFFSYSREDDNDALGALSALRERIQRELRSQLGRQPRTFRLWQDKEAIPYGKHWKAEIESAVAQSVFFIPIITPTAVAIPDCKFELDLFIAREATLGRTDLVFPIYYIEIDALEDGVAQQNDPVLSLIAKRQYRDWREFRHRDINEPAVKTAVEDFCKHIRNALKRPARISRKPKIAVAPNGSGRDPKQNATRVGEGCRRAGSRWGRRQTRANEAVTKARSTL
jgi:TIR domain